MRKRKISRKILHNNPRSIWIEDVGFIECTPADQKTIVAFGRWLADQEWFARLPESNGIMNSVFSKTSDHYVILSAMCLERLTEAYIKSRRQGTEPRWLRLVPKEVVRSMEVNYLITRLEYPDVYKIVPKMPYAGFGFVVVEDGLVEAVDRALDLGRLNYVHQLGSLHDPTVTGGEYREMATTYSHTRYGHSVEVCAFATLIGTRCELDARELATLRIAAQSHDCLTPAGGDTVKVVDLEAFDEDVNFPKVFKWKGWPEVRDRFGIDEGLLTRTILGQGLLGNILDIADKLSYVGRDLDMFLAKNWPGHQAWESFPQLYDRISSTLAQNPFPCSVWECTELRNGQLVFTDGERLADFFRMRALMMRILYANPSSRLGEAAFVSLIAKMLYEDKILTRDLLLSITDEQLFRILGKALGNEMDLPLMPRSQDPMVESFATMGEAQQFEQWTARDQPGTMTYLEVAPKTSVSCLEKFLVLRGKKIMPFSQAYDFWTADIANILHNDKPYWVYSYNLESVCRNESMRARLLEIRNHRLFGHT